MLGGHAADLFEIPDADVPRAGDAVNLAGEIMPRPLGAFGRDRSDEDVEVVGNPLPEQFPLLLEFVNRLGYNRISLHAYKYACIIP